MTSVWKHNLSFLFDHGSVKDKKSHSRIMSMFILGLMVLGIFSGNLYLFSSMVDNNIVTSGSISEKDLSSNFIPCFAPLFEDSDNSTENATELVGMGPTTVYDNLSGNAAAGDDFVDYYKIFLDNYAVSGANAHQLSLIFNNTAAFNLTLSLYDPTMHLLARSTTGSGFPNGSIVIVAQSTGMHIIKIELDPAMGYAEYNLTYEIINIVNNKLDNDTIFRMLLILYFRSRTWVAGRKKSTIVVPTFCSILILIKPMISMIFIISL